MSRRKTNERGLIKLIAVIIVAILVLSYFRVDLREFVQSEMVQKNLNYVWKLLETGWRDYLLPAWRALWDLIDKIR